MELSISNKLFRNIKNNRWQHEFSDREKIGAGGFASVYKVKNCYDDQMYAVKKVKLQFKDIRKNFEQELQKVLDEAKFLAKVKHENILRYYGSWLEATTKPNGPTKRNSTVKPSIFKLEKENMNHNNQNHIFSFEFDRDNDHHTEEIGSPIVVFDNSDDTEKSDGEIHKDEEVCTKKTNSLGKRLSQRGNNRFNLHIEEGLKIKPKLRGSVSQPMDECSTPLVRGEKLENIMLFIQTELCSDTLESYIDNRNCILQDLKKSNPEGYLKKRREYLREGLCFAKQILNGISHIHSHHVVHRDLKPSNIFMAGKTCKIGDFGLVKQLESLYPVENSPFTESAELKVNMDKEFQAPQVQVHDPEGLGLKSKKSSSDPSWKEKGESGSDNEDHHITKSIGTRMYASPEQWMADKDSFDYRADIFSLGVCFLLLFHPMSTYMERINIIKASKNGQIPEAMENELPEIAACIKKMLSIDPCKRPCIEKITQSLKLPCTYKSQLCGNIYFRKENALRWRKKYFKLIDENLHIYNRETEKKAENIYHLPHWDAKLEELLSSEERRSSTTTPQGEGVQVEQVEATPKPKEMYLKLENSDQLGCEFRSEDPNVVADLLKASEEIKGAC